MTKIIEGQFSPTPNRPHTGLLGILIKHREQLEPGNKITGNAASQLLALSRAIIEGFGGERVGDGANAQWEVDLGDRSSIADLDHKVTKALCILAEGIGSQINGISNRLSCLEDAEAARMSGIQEMSAEVGEILPDPRIETLEQRNTDLEKTVERLAADMSRLEAVFRSASNVEPPPAVEFQPAKRPGRRTLADLPPIGLPTKLADKS